MSQSSGAGWRVLTSVEAAAGALRSAAQDAVESAVAKVAARVGDAAGGARQQTLTIARPATDVLAAWRDPQTLSRLLGDLGRVEREGERYRWTLVVAGSEHPWEAELTERADGLRFTAAPPAAGDASGQDGTAEGTSGGSGTPSSIDVEVREAPQGLGTEVRLALDLPVPGLAAGAAAFTVLYRLRALLQTGEVPTLGPQPAARAASR